MSFTVQAWGVFSYAFAYTSDIIVWTVQNALNLIDLTTFRTSQIQIRYPEINFNQRLNVPCNMAYALNSKKYPNLQTLG